MSYAESWGFLNKYRPYRCYLCPDGTSEFADISCGDPWYRETKEDASGYSLVLVRTEKGRKILNGAIESEYVSLKPTDPKILEKSQKNLLLKRGAIWGRLLTMKAFGIPTPHYKGFSLFKNWLTIPLMDKVRSIFGTARRIIQRKYYRKSDYR
ncbi:MAG: Coenzyme F420 hydrogenase/dehydrogenase, beta subunit C-terminal domain [Deltaproteobacteria bacterium]|nr:Coenzyme F420 hydrogenase/dehydrogenase, beta subunit C-terminal domain [Deltaproteobacteria bacterium]